MTKSYNSRCTVPSSPWGGISAEIILSKLVGESSKFSIHINVWVCGAPPGVNECSACLYVSLGAGERLQDTIGVVHLRFWNSTVLHRAMHFPKIPSFSISLMKALYFCQYTRAIMSGRSYGFWPGINWSITSLQNTSIVKVMNR